jgi:hypothetical protein
MSRDDSTAPATAPRAGSAGTRACWRRRPARVGSPRGMPAPAARWSRLAPGVTLSFYTVILHCRSALSLAAIGCHSLGICTVILLSLLPYFSQNDGVTLRAGLAGRVEDRAALDLRRGPCCRFASPLCAGAYLLKCIALAPRIIAHQSSI